MTDNSSFRAKSNSIAKIILIAVLVYMAYLLSCYVENGRYSTTSSERGFIITDTRTGESRLYWQYFEEGWETTLFQHVTVFDLHGQIQISKSENAEDD